MTPSIPSRIDSLIQAMRDIVLPAIAADRSIAVEQAHLIVAHLSLIKEQLPNADAFQAIELKAAVTLGRRLIDLEPANPALAEERSALQAALDEAPRQTVMQDAIRSVKSAEEDFVRALRLLGSRPAIDAMTRAVLDHGREESRRNRIWFASSGFDAERDSLPAMASLFTDMR